MERKRIFHQKLVRDKIPEIIMESGDECRTTVLDDPGFDFELRRKLLEEAREL